MNPPPRNPVSLPPPRRPSWSARIRLLLIAAAFPLASGLALYGWRAGLSVALLLLCAAWAGAIWRKIGPRGAGVTNAHLIAFSLLLALMLPPHLLAGLPQNDAKIQNWLGWTIVPSAALLLAALLWLTGHRGSKRVHPLTLTFLIIAALFHPGLLPHLVLHRSHVVTGDLADAAAARLATEEPWIRQTEVGNGHDALRFESIASRRLSDHTSGRRTEGEWLSLDGLIRSAMPPLEDMVIGGHPAAMGTSSAIAVLVGGLFLVHRRVIPAGVPLLVLLTAYLCFFILPVPVVVTQQGPVWRPLVAPRAHEDIGAVITFANYELMASPLLFMGFFLAPMHGICPRARPARTRYAFLLGIMAAAAQIYISVSFGAYIALALVNLLAPTLEGRRE